MKPFFIILLTGALLFPGCGKDKVKPSADFLLSQEAAEKIDMIKTAYVSRSNSNLRTLIDPPLSDSIINALSFSKAALSFNQRLVRIAADVINVSVSWHGSWWLSDDREFSHRGVADLIFQRETMKLSKITGDNPFIPHYRGVPGQSEVTDMGSPPEPPIKTDTDVTKQSLPTKVDKETSPELKPFNQDRENTAEVNTPRDGATPSLPETAGEQPFTDTEPLSQKWEDNAEIYTIQTGSFLDLESARVQYDLIVILLEEKNYDNLRIEKIGDFYAVRLGIYDSSLSADNMLQELIHEIDSPVVMKSFIKKDRIIEQQSRQAQ
jgi:hypothetical protein